MSKFTVILSDGTQLTNLELNGNNFISNDTVTQETFSGRLSKVVITGDPEEDECGLIGEHENMALVRVQERDGKSWFILRDMSHDELEKLKDRSNIDYLAMMTGIDL